MRHKLLTTLALAAGLLTASEESFAQQSQVFTVKANEIQAEVAPTMWGVFFEDINLGADGGIYAELVKNRSFEFKTPMMGWKEEKRGGAEGTLLVHNRGAAQLGNPRFLRVAVKSDQGEYGLSNEGFRGMGVKKGDKYNFYVLARQLSDAKIGLVVELVDQKGERIGTATVTPEGKDWKEYKATITATATDPKAQLLVLAKGRGEVDLDMISLFPEKTWKNRPKGMRPDMVQLLADMKPGFFRFPGGCIVEGRTLDERFQWKKTIGPIETRELTVNRWNTEFGHRLTPDYFQSFGLGFFEYFQLAEDMGAEPLPILNCGMACQFNTAEVVPMAQLDTYIQDALDLIEFANGSVETPWGKKRAEMGHPEPFNMKYIGVGNEQWGEQYVERYKAFAKVLTEKHPEIQLITTTGPFPDGKEFDYLNTTLRSMKDARVDIIDEHYYRAPEWFRENATRYDSYDRNGPKIFAGEYASQTVAIASPDNKNNWNGAMSEAAFMTGLERNAGVVVMASYAPLFAHIEGWQWTPDMIWVDNLRSFGTPNYQVQKLFSTNSGTHVVPVLRNNKPVTGQDGTYASATIDKATNELILKIVNTSDRPQQGEFVVDGVKKLQQKGTVTVLQSDNLNQENTFENPDAISPKQQQIQVKDKKIKLPMKPYSVNVVRVKMS
ncbi:alpha-L-arabinofuranosidase C-terminal domain-containing protein [Pontibacter akesuensis]|uniref:non-reducing end alpha-L-arabinofuranosidase n=1 Tax=Pontibacter akesuensis TaxID=388950 RepID=A0A1I7JD67_9BACT|nr:alpha-L-arabinofuranosidase C-terminal domain-containing protein [Pontibacter akesuensis]GHA70781.1 alpha-L-arabinofuranosidase [Pontibacter akesuensis]SFU83146.1 Alpha-L-arabinofuranosidase [Pontibacter akesuensis]